MESPTFRKFGELLENLFEFDDECNVPSFTHDVGKLHSLYGHNITHRLEPQLHVYLCVLIACFIRII